MKKALFDAKYRKLKKCYDKVLANLAKKASNNPAYLMDYFITYLKMLRDGAILSLQPDASKDDELNASALATAVAEYESFKTTEISEDTSEIRANH